ncbi:hypothetical protein [Aquimarina aquimarini]|uniref:hypothetical protein n=1 Tax=Aquimarina aquimarini TaxID=1191734 RepID=UPI001F2CBA55|nr:hypothetical protein [Aquimarina aquimarini]
MKYIHYIVIILVGGFTTLCSWIYIKRANFDYNTQGKFLSPEDGVVYNEQAKEIYGFLALFGLILMGIIVNRLIKKAKKKAKKNANKTSPRIDT